MRLFARHLQFVLRVAAILLLIPIAARAATPAVAPMIARAASKRPSPAPAGPFPASTDASTITPVGNLAGSATSVEVLDTRAYIGNADSLRIVDISNPASPLLLGSYQTPAADVQVVGAHAYIASAGRLKIVDISNPAHPTLRGTIDLPSRGEGGSAQAKAVQVVGTIAYVINQQTIYGIPPHRSDLEILDVSNPNKPALRGSYPLGPSFNSFQIADNYAYIGGAVDIGGTARFFADYLLILDLHNPERPVEQGYYLSDCPALIGCINYLTSSLALVDSTVYLGFAGQPGIRLIDVSNPISPTLRSTYPITGADLQLAGRDVYVASGGAGLQALDASKPFSPTLRAAYDTRGIATAVQVRGDLLYIADGPGGFQIARFTQRAVATISSSGGALESPADLTTYSFPAGAFSGPTVVTHTLRLPEIIPPPGSLVGIGHRFEVAATDSLTGLPVQPAKPYTLTVEYTDDEKGPAVADTLALYFWDGDGWVKEPSSQVDTAARTITATPVHFSIWAALGETRRMHLPLIE